MEIHHLSPAQLALTPQVRDDWLAIALDTAPVDRAHVRDILGRLYASAGRPVPQHICFLESPLQVSMLISLLRLQDEPVSRQVSDPIRNEVLKQIGRHVTPPAAPPASALILGQSAFESTIAGIVPSVPVYDHICAQLRENLRDMSGSLRVWPFLRDFGQFNVSLAWHDFLARLGVDVSPQSFQIELAKSTGFAVLFWDWAFISAKPQWIHRDARGRLHSETGAALRYPDGFSVHALHGVRVPARMVNEPQTITLADIEAEPNAEVRRVMIKLYGHQRFLLDAGAEEIHRDDFGILYRRAIPGDEALVMVKVVNATPEPDGSFRDYFLRVPPTMTRARQAVAWTFGKKENDYAPTFQT